MTGKTLILGIGNVLWADEGFGTRAIEALHERFEFPDDVEVLDGGTQGMFLLPWIRSATRLLVFDAVDFGDPPATLRLVLGCDVPRYMGAKKVSMHQTGFQEVLASADFAGELPGDLALVGVQPELLDDYGGSLRPNIKAQINPAIRLALQVLDRWGIPHRRRRSPPADAISPAELDMGDYEKCRPFQRETSL